MTDPIAAADGAGPRTHRRSVLPQGAGRFFAGRGSRVAVWGTAVVIAGVALWLTGGSSPDVASAPDGVPPPSASSGADPVPPADTFENPPAPGSPAGPGQAGSDPGQGPVAGPGLVGGPALAGAQTSPPAPGAGPSTGGPADPGDTRPIAPDPARSDDDLFKRQDPVPEGVAAQVKFFLGGIGGGGDCNRDGEDSGGPWIDGAEVVETPAAPVFCFRRFDLERPLQVALVPPAGDTETVELAPLPLVLMEDFAHGYQFLPGSRLGAYTIIVTQDDVTVRHRFVVRRATTPTLMMDPRRTTVPPEGKVRILLGGFPRGTVSLDLYNAVSQAYLTSFPVTVDANGEAYHVLRIRKDDPPGFYGVSHPLVYSPDFGFSSPNQFALGEL